MGQIDVELFEAFKSLEKICNEIYGQNKGVSLYITDMENTSIYEANKIRGWDADLKRLKKLRYIRNNMAHEDTVISETYTGEDIAFLKAFRERILKTEDPLALKRRLQKTNSSISSPTKIVSSGVKSYNPEVNKKVEPQRENPVYVPPKRNGVRLVILVIIIMALLFLYLAWDMGLLK